MRDNPRIWGENHVGARFHGTKDYFESKHQEPKAGERPCSGASWFGIWG